MSDALFVRLLRLALRAFPSDFRHRHGEDLLATHRALRRDLDGPGEEIRFLCRALPELVWNGLRERLASAGSSLRPGLFLSGLGLDLRVAVRSLVRRSGLSAVVVLTLALGLGANLLLFSLYDAVLLRPLPYAEPERLVRLVHSDLDDGSTGPLSWPDLQDVAERSETLAGLAAYDEWQATLTGVGDARRIDAALVNARFFDLLGVTPRLGRTFRPAEDVDGQDRVVISSHELWTGAFGSDPAVLGRRIDLDGFSHEIVGVLPPEFQDPRLGAEHHRPLLYRPFGFGGVAADRLPGRGGRSYDAVARLRDGVPLERARSELRVLASALRREHPETNADRDLAAEPLHLQMVEGVAGSLELLFAAVLCVLGVAVANVLGLLTARAAERRQELALRRALGAGRGRLVRLRLVESGLLVGSGTVLGAAGAHLGLVAVRSLGERIPRIETTALDLQAGLFALALAAIVAVVCGVLPGLLVGERLRRSQRGAVGAETGGLLPSLLVVGQIAMALVLVTAAALLLRSLDELASVDPGLDSENLLTFQLKPPSARYDEAQTEALYARLEERLRSLPGVENVALANLLPLSGSFDGGPVHALDRPEPLAGRHTRVEWRTVTPSFFSTVGVPILRGNAWSEGVLGEGDLPIVVSAGLARHLWPAQDDVLGERLSVGDQPAVIVGVASELKHQRLDEPAPYRLYMPRERTGASWQLRRATVFLRLFGDAAAVSPAVRRVIREEDPNLALASMQTMDEVVGSTLGEERLRTVLLTSFGILALLLAAVGVHALLSQSVTTRRGEIAVRLAIGADRSDVLRHVLGRASRLLLVGVGLGAVLSLGLGRGLEAYLYGVRPGDPVLLAICCLVLGSAGLLAAWWPARRAARTDPMELLREE